MTYAGINKAKTHCPKGHPYSGKNLAVEKRGSRACLACRTEGKHRRYWLTKGLPVPPKKLKIRFAERPAAERVADFLRQNGHPALIAGDGNMLQSIADFLGYGHRGNATERAIFAAIERSIGVYLIKDYIRGNGRGCVWRRCFWLPECSPAGERK